MSESEMRDAVEKRIAAGEIDDALREIEQILTVASREGRWDSASWGARKKAQCYFTTNRIHDATSAALEALELARRSGDVLEEAEAENALGILHGEIGELGSAVEHLERSYELHRFAGSARIASVLNNIGNTCLIMGDAKRALGYFRRSVEEARNLTERSRQDRIVEGTALANVGRALTTLERPDEALPILRESIDLFSAMNMEALRIHALVKLAVALERDGDYDEAEKLYEEALASAGRLEGETWAYEIHGSLASLLIARNRHDEAEPHLRQAIDGVPAGTTVSDTPYWRRLYSELLERRGETAAALEEMRRAFEELEESSKQRAETQLYRAMGRLELQRVEHEKEVYRLKSEELEELAARDALTGLFNRRWFTARLSTEVERARRYGHALSVIMLDVDDFKSVNDSFGHPAGDQVLVGIADLLTQNTRGSDEVARYGGEEFAVIMPETALQEATVVCEKLRKVVAQSSWGEKEDLGPVTVSIGVSEMSEGDTPGTILDRADSRLYLAKARGRNRVVAAE